MANYQGYLSQLQAQQMGQPPVAPTGPSPALDQTQPQQPMNQGPKKLADMSSSEIMQKAIDRLTAARATGMDPLSTFLLAASQPGPGNFLSAIARGGIAAQQAMAQNAQSDEERQLKILDLAATLKSKQEAAKLAADERLEAARLAAKEREREAANKPRKFARVVDPSGKTVGVYDVTTAEGAKAVTDAGLKGFDVYELGTEPRPAVDKPMPVATQKKIFDLTDKANNFEQDANKYESLANQFEKEKPTAGLFGNIKKKSKEIFGTEDFDTYLRTEWQAIQRQQMLQNLPKGAASDADVRITREAQLGDFANPKLAASLLRGMAKIKKWNSQLLNFQSDFISNNPTKSTSLEDMEIGGIMIPKGTTYSGAVKLFNEKTPLNSIFNVSEEPNETKSSNIEEADKILGLKK